MARFPKPSGNKGDFGSPRDFNNSRKPIGSRLFLKQIIIIVEGTKTEDAYFKSLARDFHVQTVKVSVINGHKKTAPLQIVERAINKRAELRKKDEWEEDIDEMWCVFDTEDNQNGSSLKTAFSLIEREGLRTDVSNPCFEYWYLLHFEETDKPFQNAREVISHLNRHINGYSKKKCYYPILKGSTLSACNNTENLRKRNFSNWNCMGNPSTGTDVLVKMIVLLSKK
jgi:hypothetical protein